MSVFGAGVDGDQGRGDIDGVTQMCQLFTAALADQPVELPSGIAQQHT